MESARVWFFWLFAGGTLLSLLVLGTIQLIALMRMRSLRRRRPDSGRPLPPISILKPIKGLDPELRPNLEALLAQDYPEYEVLFAVKDPDDPVIPVLRELIRNHPGAPLRLFVGATGPGMNPKVKSLGYVARYARHEHLLISDADVRPPPDYLSTLASELGEGVGLVHSLLLGTGERRLGSVLESLHMNSFVAASLCGADWIGHSCVVGKSMLFSRRDLAEIGGFAAVENVLAEDYLG